MTVITGVLGVAERACSVVVLRVLREGMARASRVNKSSQEAGVKRR